jgi:hypothetical protein
VADDTLTLALDGDVSLAEFAEAIRHFDSLVQAIARAESADHVRWVVANLEVSSTIATTRGIAAPDQPEATIEKEIERVVSGYLRVGQSLERGEPIPYTNKDVIREAEAITAVLNGTVKSVRFETAADEALVAAPAARPDSIKGKQTAYGAVEGRVQTLTTRGGLRFTLYDTLHDRAVSCYLARGREDQMRDVWGRRAVVEGIVTRDASTGRPLAVREITAVELIPEVEPRKYRELRGISPSRGLSAEEAIRRLRDAG